MQKALTQMNVQLHNVISDITGATGMRILQAIVRGERDGTKLAELCDPGIRASREVVIKSLADSLGTTQGISGGAILGDGSISLILDVPGLIELATVN